MTRRSALIGLASTSLLVAVMALLMALNPLFLHGFAVVCSDGYAEAFGTAPCRPDWPGATPYLVTAGLAIAVAATAAVTFRRLRPPLTH